LIVLGALSLLALFVNELRDPNAMAKQPDNALGAVGRLLFIIFQMEDPFRSWWYRLLMGVLTLSLFACVLERTPIVWRLWKRPANSDTSWADHAPTAIIRSVNAPREEIEKRVGHTWKWRLKQDDVWVGERGRSAMWGPLLTHYGMLALVIGALVTSFGGVTTRNGGYSGDVIALEGMPFEVRVDSFRVQYYPLQAGQWVLVDNQWIGKLAEMNADSTWIVLQYRTETDYDRVSMEPQYIRNHWDNDRDRGNIKRFVSWVTVFEDGQEVEQQEVAVNSPLRRHGYRFYQSSYDPDNPRFTANYAKVTVAANDSASGTSHTLTLKPGESVPVPGDTLTITAGKLLPNFKLGADFKARSEGAEFANPAVELTFRGPNGFEKSQWTFVKFPSHNPGPGKYVYQIAELDGEHAAMEMATIFEIKKTNGTELLWLGFFLGTIGLVLSFYLNHRVLYIEWPQGTRNHIRLIGLTRKTHHLYERDLDRLLEGVSGHGKPEPAAEHPRRPATLNK
jgi:cytochrome c biogenesis protein